MNTYNDKVATVGVVIAALAIIVSVVTPEIRNFFIGKEDKPEVVKDTIVLIPKIPNDTMRSNLAEPITSENPTNLNPKPQKPEETSEVKPTINTDFENVSYSGSAGLGSGKILFFNTSKNTMEFTGILDGYKTINGSIKIEGKKLIITESENCIGSFTLLENGNKIVGTPKLTQRGNESISVVLYKL